MLVKTSAVPPGAAADEFARSPFRRLNAVARRMLSLHKHAFPHSARGTLERIRLRSLDSAVDDVVQSGHSFDTELLVKIDVQGFEDEVVRGGERLLRSTRVVIIETSFEELYIGQPMFPALHEILAGLGFSFRGNLSQLRHPEDGRVLQADSIFVR